MGGEAEGEAKGVTGAWFIPLGLGWLANWLKRGKKVTGKGYQPAVGISSTQKKKSSS
jgi:hypothetical protein